MIPTTTPKDLRNAYKKEKDPRVRARMAAASMVCMNNDSIQKQQTRSCSPPTGSPSGQNALRRRPALRASGIPQSERPAAISGEKMDVVMGQAKNMEITSAMLQQDLVREHGVRFHISYIRKIMHKHSMTPKTATRIRKLRHKGGAVYGWQSRLDYRISRLK